MLDLASNFGNLRDLRCRAGGERWQSHIRWEWTCADQTKSGWDSPIKNLRTSLADADAAAAADLSDLEEANLDFMFPLAGPDDAIDQRLARPNLVGESP